jgi:hypothetical protein
MSKKHVADRFRDMQELLDALDSVFQKGTDKNTEKHTQGNAHVRQMLKNRPLIAGVENQKSKKFFSRKILLLGIFLFPLLVFLILLFMLSYKPPSTLQEISQFTIRAAYEERNLESDANGGYPTDHLFDKDLKTAWLTPMPRNFKNPIIILDFAQSTIITDIGFAIGYQKSIDDQFGDRFRIYNKPKILYLQTREGYRQSIALEDLKGMQYPDIKTVETTEIQIFLDEAYIYQSR